MNIIMTEQYILDFAKDDNADETYAKIRDWQDLVVPVDIDDAGWLLVDIANRYEMGEVDDRDFCQQVVNYFKHFNI